MFDLSPLKILILGVLAVVIFGPEQLPRVAGQAGRFLRDIRAVADRARSDLRENLGSEFSDFDFNDLNPRAFVRKHLLEDTGTGDAGGSLPPPEPSWPAAPVALLAGEEPPFDSEAT